VASGESGEELEGIYFSGTTLQIAHDGEAKGGDAAGSLAAYSSHFTMSLGQRDQAGLKYGAR